MIRMLSCIKSIMQRQDPLPLLFVFLFFLAVSAVSKAQQHVAADTVPPMEEVAEELERIQELTSYGPHYKNPHAAGRLLTLNRVVPPLPADYGPVRLSGPAYKNQEPAARPGPSTTVPSKVRENLTGPRYKNRRAKTGNL